MNLPAKLQPGRGRGFVLSIRNLCPWGKEELKKYSFPCVYTTDPNSSKGAFRINWESALCCKRSLNTYLPNPGFKHRSDVCLWQLWSCRHHGVSRQRIRPLPTAPWRVDVPRSTVTAPDLAIAAPFCTQTPALPVTSGFTNPTGLEAFCPFPCVTSLAMASSLKDFQVHLGKKFSPTFRSGFLR